MIRRIAWRLSCGVRNWSPLGNSCLKSRFQGSLKWLDCCRGSIPGETAYHQPYWSVPFLWSFSLGYPLFCAKKSPVAVTGPYLFRQLSYPTLRILFRVRGRSQSHNFFFLCVSGNPLSIFSASVNGRLIARLLLARIRPFPRSSCLLTLVELHRARLSLAGLACW